MQVTWQEIATIAILLVAACYVARRIARFINRKGMSDCAYCSRCRANMPQKPLIQLEDHLHRSDANDARR